MCRRRHRQRRRRLHSRTGPLLRHLRPEAHAGAGAGRLDTGRRSPTPPASWAWPVPMARTAADVAAAVFETLAGYDARDPFVFRAAGARAMPSYGVRVAVMSGRPVQPVCADAVERAAALLAAMGPPVRGVRHGTHRRRTRDVADPVCRLSHAGHSGDDRGREDECSWTSLQLTSMRRENRGRARDWARCCCSGTACAAPCSTGWALRRSSSRPPSASPRSTTASGGSLSTAARSA